MKDMRPSAGDGGACLLDTYFTRERPRVLLLGRRFLALESLHKALMVGTPLARAQLLHQARTEGRRSAATCKPV